MKSATVQEMETIIRTSSIPDLKSFMRNMLDFVLHKETYEKHFGSAMDNFIQACRNIVIDPTSVRLSKLIERLFTDAKLSEILSPGSMPSDHAT